MRLTLKTDLDLADDLELMTQKGLVTRYTHLKYEGHNSNQSKDIANVKVFADKQTDKRTYRWAKNYVPPVYRGGGIKKTKPKFIRH